MGNEDKIDQMIGMIWVFHIAEESEDIKEF